MTGQRWAIVTGEYPDQPGGVSDYVRLVARGLAEAGDEVHVWAPAWDGDTASDEGVRVHRLPDCFGPASLASLGADLDRLERPYRLLVQYVPHAFGWKAMNVPFCLWLLARRHNPTLVMFHEVAYPLGLRQPLRHNFLAAVNRLMAWLTARSAHGLFASIPAWLDALRSLARSRTPLHWLPVPSTLPTVVDPEEVAAVRDRLKPDPDCLLVGHFGTFGPLVAPMLVSVLPAVLEADERRVGLLLGRGGEAFAEEILRKHPGLRGHLHAAGNVPAERVAVHLAACDLLIQPYPDGISSRRTSATCSLALGRPVVTTEGPLSEPLWRASKAVLLAPATPSTALVEAAELALRDHDLRAALGARAAELYRERFTLQRVIAALRDA